MFKGDLIEPFVNVDFEFCTNFKAYTHQIRKKNMKGEKNVETMEKRKKCY